VLQFGGAVGTLAALGGRGAEVANNLAEELALGLPEIPWHSHRDRVAEVATSLGLCVGTLGKSRRIFRCIRKPRLRKFSSGGDEPRRIFDHAAQRNPVASAVVLSAAVRVPGLVSAMLTAMVQEHERGLGGWHAEWETLPEIVSLSAGALHQMAEVIPKLEIDTERMLENLEATRGLIFGEAVSMALAEKMGKAQRTSSSKGLARKRGRRSGTSRCHSLR